MPATSYDRPTGVPAPDRTTQGTQPRYLVPFSPGDGGEQVLLTVSYWAEYLRDPDGLCAFCHHNIDAWSNPATLIGDYFVRCGSWADTCPNCLGRPS
jgi:hypothetical protein